MRSDAAVCRLRKMWKRRQNSTADLRGSRGFLSWLFRGRDHCTISVIRGWSLVLRRNVSARRPRRDQPPTGDAWPGGVWCGTDDSPRFQCARYGEDHGEQRRSQQQSPEAENEPSRTGTINDSPDGQPRGAAHDHRLQQQPVHDDDSSVENDHVQKLLEATGERERPSPVPLPPSPVRSAESIAAGRPESPRTAPTARADIQAPPTTARRQQPSRNTARQTIAAALLPSY